MGAEPNRLDRHAFAPQTAEALVENDNLARLAGATGTPHFVIGNRILRGAVPLSELERVIAEVRSGLSPVSDRPTR